MFEIVKNYYKKKKEQTNKYIHTYILLHSIINKYKKLNCTQKHLSMLNLNHYVRTYYIVLHNQPSTKLPSLVHSSTVMHGWLTICQVKSSPLKESFSMQNNKYVYTHYQHLQTWCTLQSFPTNKRQKIVKRYSQVLSLVS